MAPAPICSIVPLDAGLGAELASMTFPAYRHLLSLEIAPRHPEQGDARLIRPVGVIARVGDDIVGLALAEQPVEEPYEAEVLSVFVGAEHRRRGVATRMLEALESELRVRGVLRVQAVYTTGKPSEAAVEALLARRGWDAPVVRTVSVGFTPEEAASTPWFGRLHMPEGFEVFPWTQLSAAERDALERSHAERPWIREGLEFWRHDRLPVDPISSLGARFEGRVVGWVLNHRVNDDLVRFTCSFMRQDLSRRARILPLYTASLERLRTDGRTKWCTFVTPVEYTEMVAFVRKRCAPWISFVGETRGSAKSLTDPGLPGHRP